MKLFVILELSESDTKEVLVPAVIGVGSIAGVAGLVGGIAVFAKRLKLGKNILFCLYLPCD